MTTPDDTGFRCRRGERCADGRREPATQPDGTTTTVTVPARATSPDGLCRMDTTHTLRAVQQLPRDYLELGLLLGKAGRGLDAPTAGTRDLPVPLRLGVLALQEEIAAEVELWAEAVADHLGLPWAAQTVHTARATHAGRRLPTGCAVLADHHTTLLALPPVEQLAWTAGEPRVRRTHCPGGHWHPRGGVCHRMHVRTVWHDDHREWTARDGVDGALALLDLHERVEQVEGRTRRAHHLWVPCPRCQTLALEREEGSSVVYCRRCPHIMSLDEAERLTDILAEAHGAGAAA